jgi:tetratricopeptide (TPR) repeat protein
MTDAQTQTPTSEQRLADGHAAWFDGKPHQALACFSEAVALLPEDASPDLAVRAKGDLALCLRETGDVAAALALYPELERLCLAGGLDVTKILRQWAIALEVARDFAAARRLLNRIRPTDRSARMDRLYWNHAMGLLNWSEGRLGDARAHLAAATAALPRKRQEAARVLAVLGNDALLSLYLGDTMRAYRLVQRMRDIRAAVSSVPVASESSLVIAQASLARARGDFAQEAEILRQGLDLIERTDPEEWLHKLDLASRFAEAATRAGAPGSAIPWLQTLCDTAPFDMAWVGLTTLAQLQVDAGDAEAATGNIQHLLAVMAGAGGVEVEAEVLATLADLAHLRGRRDAAIVLGKMSLRYMAELIHRLDHDTLVTVLAANDRHVTRIGGHLRSAGRFQEAVLLDDLVNRIRHYALVRRDDASDALAFQPLPFDRLETRLEADWSVWRQELFALRDAGCRDDLMCRAGEVLEALLGFETTTGLAYRAPLLPPPPRPGCVQVSLVPAGTECELQYQWSDRMERVRLGVNPADLFDRVAGLREALCDPQAWREPAARLYRWIIGPIEAELDSIDCLLVEASGLLGRIPMAVLHDGRVCLGPRVPITYVLNVERRAHDPASGRGILHASAFRTDPPCATDSAPFGWSGL